MSTIPPRSLKQTIGYIATIAHDAKELYGTLAAHQRQLTGQHELVGALSRFEHTLRDFALGFANARAALSPQMQAALELAIGSQ